MKNILLTGAAGFIGSNVVRLLLDSGYHVDGIDNLNDYYDPRLKRYRLSQLKDYSNFNFYMLDIADMAALEKVFNDRRYDAIINLAARAGVRYSIENPFVYFSSNTLGTLNLLEMMKIKGINKIILASSSSLYAGSEMPFHEDLPVNNPISPYAASKKSAEMLAYTYHHLYKFDATILRYFTVFGPCGRPDMSYFRFIKKIDEGNPIEVFGDGKQTRDFTYIDDIARGTLLALDAPGYEIINLGGGKIPVSINFMIEKISEHLGKEAKIIYKDFFDADMKDTGADIAKATRLLNWKPEIDFEEGINKTVDWHIENRDWLRDIK